MTLIKRSFTGRQIKENTCLSCQQSDQKFRWNSFYSSIPHALQFIIGYKTFWFPLTKVTCVENPPNKRYQFTNLILIIPMQILCSESDQIFDDKYKYKYVFRKWSKIWCQQRVCEAEPCKKQWYLFHQNHPHQHQHQHQHQYCHQHQHIFHNFHPHQHHDCFHHFDCHQVMVLERELVWVFHHHHHNDNNGNHHHNHYDERWSAVWVGRRRFKCRWPGKPRPG